MTRKIKRCGKSCKAQYQCRECRAKCCRHFSGAINFQTMETTCGDCVHAAIQSRKAASIDRKDGSATMTNDEKLDTKPNYTTPFGVRVAVRKRKRLKVTTTDAATITEETHELQRDASALAYTAIRFSGLYRELSSREWEALAERLGARAVAVIETGIAEEAAQREAENQQMDAWLSTGGSR